MPNGGHVCRKCWLQISTFHEFYNYIESIHATGQTIFQGYQFFAGDEDVCGAYGFEAKVESPKIGNVAVDAGGNDDIDNGADGDADDGNGDDADADDGNGNGDDDDNVDEGNGAADDVDYFQLDEQPKSELISMPDQVEVNPRPKRKRKEQKTTSEITRKKSFKKGPTTSRVFQ